MKTRERRRNENTRKEKEIEESMEKSAENAGATWYCMSYQERFVLKGINLLRRKSTLKSTQNGRKIHLHLLK
jgi:hypothetical protein